MLSKVSLQFWFMKQYPAHIFADFEPIRQIEVIFNVLNRVKTDRPLPMKIRELLLSYLRNCADKAIHVRLIDHLEELKTIIAAKLEINFSEDYAQTRHDRDPDQIKKLPFRVVLSNIRSAFNVGSIFRTADHLGVEMIYCHGFTPTAENIKIQKTSMGAHEFQPWQKMYAIKQDIGQLKKDGFSILALETTKNAKAIHELTGLEKCVLLLGNECFGLEETTLALADEILKIPQMGIKNSLNVSSAFAIACYQIGQSLRHIKKS